jgi:hypothetical protein
VPASFVDTNAIGQIGEIAPARLAAGDRLAQESKRLSPQVTVVVGVLCDQPGVV